MGGVSGFDLGLAYHMAQEKGLKTRAILDLLLEASDSFAEKVKK